LYFVTVNLCGGMRGRKEEGEDGEEEEEEEEVVR
jgi:hypothetical protein